MSSLYSSTTLAKAPVDVSEYAKAIQEATALDENGAKTVLYYAIASYAVERLKMMPILVLRGAPGTGKSTLIEILKQITCSPININGKDSKASLRDSLKQNTTALIEEADNVDEDMLIDRYSKGTSGRTVKRLRASKGYEGESLNLFGATVLHRRVPFKDPAVKSRSIEIMTSLRDGFAGKSFPSKLDRQPLKDIADSIEWGDFPSLGGGRVLDTWTPLLVVADACEDGEWIDYATARIEEDEESLKVGHDVEPRQRVFQAVLALVSEEGESTEPKQEVALRDITLKLKDDRPELSSWQVGQIIRDLTFETTKRGGVMRVHVKSKDKLRQVAQTLGLEDEWLK